MIPSYPQHIFSSMKFCLWDGQQRFILVNPQPFAFNMIIEDPFFITSNDILEIQVISLPWKKTCHYGYAIFLLLIKSMRNPLAHFTYFFKWQQIVDWNELRSNANSGLLLCRLHSTNSLKVSLIKIWWASRSEFISQCYETLKTSLGLSSQ